MRLLDDERGQSVQVGAAILLGFVVIAVTIYQVQVVSSQNAEVEFNHNQEVRQDLVELRNAIHNAGAQGEGEATTVQLGTQYPPRTIFVNPAPPSGQLETEPVGNVTLRNVAVENPGAYSNAGDSPQGLFDRNFSTSSIAYRPDYSEFDGAGDTVIEHSLAFNRFENNVTNAITPQLLVNEDRIQITLIQGNLSEQSSGTIAVDPATVSGPTDTMSVTSDSGGPIELFVPTNHPDVWNETIGTLPGEGVDNATAIWEPASGRMRLELESPSYDLQMAVVGVGTGVRAPDGFDVRRQDGSSGGGGGYDLFWDDPSSEEGTVAGNCDAQSCTWNSSQDSTDSEFELTANTSPPVDNASVDFAVANSSVLTVSGDGDTTDGTITATVNPNSTGTTTVYASTGGDTAEIEITIENTSSGAAGPSISARVDDLTREASDQPVFIASYDVSNTDSSFERVDVTFDSSGGETLSDSSTTPRAGLRYAGGHGAGTTYTITYEVIYTDTNGNEYVATSTSITDMADGVNPGSNPDLAVAGSAQLTSWSIDDRSQTSQSRPRYRYSYGVSNTGSFSEVRIHALNVPGSGESGVTAFTNRNQNNQDIQLSYGGGEDYRIGLVVRDANGVVVDVVSIVDTADDSGTYSGP